MPKKAFFCSKKKDEVKDASEDKQQKGRVAESVDQAGKQIEKLLRVGETELVEDFVYLHLTYCQGCHTCQAAEDKSSEGEVLIVLVKGICSRQNEGKGEVGRPLDHVLGKALT